MQTWKPQYKGRTLQVKKLFLRGVELTQQLQCLFLNHMNHSFTLGPLSVCLFPGDRFSTWRSSTSFVTRWGFQAVFWGPTSSTRSPNGPAAPSWSPQPHATHPAQHHPPPSPAPPHAHPAHAEPRRVRMCVCVHTVLLNNNRSINVTQHCGPASLTNKQTLSETHL